MRPNFQPFADRAPGPALYGPMLRLRRPLFAGAIGLVFAFVAFACGEPSGPPDAGLDAGVFDAGNSDAIVVDSADGADAPDASASDAADAGDQADAADAEPQLPANALRGTQVVAGERWSAVVGPSGALYAFGQYINPVNGHYQIGGSYARTPVLVQGVDSVKEITGYGEAFFALNTNGTVSGWGHINTYSAFGQGTDAASGGAVIQNAPVLVLTASATPIRDVCQVVTTPHGSLMVRSAEGDGACSPGGARTVWYTGDTLSGQERGLEVSLFAKRFAPLDPASPSNVTGGVSVESIHANSYAANSVSLYARLTDGRVFAWGSNNYGQLGLGDRTPRDTPTAATGWDNALAISSSVEVTLAIVPSGGLIAAGTAYGGTLGNGTQGSTLQTTPAAVSTLTQVSRVSVATSFSGALAIQSGELFFWGTTGHFGAPATSPRAVVGANGPFVEVSIGGVHALALSAEGGVYSFGSNPMGALGCGTCVERIEPTLVTMP